MAGSIDRLKGTVMWFDVRRGFGFIMPEGGGDDIFVHQSSIKAVGYRSLAAGEIVEFILSEDDDGRSRAVDVTGPGGAYINGSRYFNGTCYRCGEVGHMAMNCKSNGGSDRLGPCFCCGEMGHLARECPATRFESSSSISNRSKSSKQGSISHLSPPISMRPDLVKGDINALLDRVSKSTASDEDEELPREVEERNWAELPYDVLSVIFKKIGTVEVIMSAQFVCRPWRLVSNEPELWRCIDMTNQTYGFDMTVLESMAMMAVDRSEGHVEEFYAKDFGTDVLMGYLAGRATRLRGLRLISIYHMTDKALIQAVRRFPQLVDLEISRCSFSDGVIDWVALACPRIKTFKLTARPYTFEDDLESDLEENADKQAMAIAKHMQQLRRLHLLENSLTNKGLSAILDNCPYLECLDIRGCSNVDLDENMMKQCARIKDLRHPNESVDDYRLDETGEIEIFGGSFEHEQSDTEYDFGYDDMGYYGDFLDTGFGMSTNYFF